MNAICCEKKKGFDLNSVKTVAILVCLLCFFVSSNLMAATYTVGIGKDYATITEAIVAATGGDTIDVYGTITLAGDGQSAANTGVTVDKNLTIQGQGTNQTYVQAAASKGTADRRVFTIDAGTIVTLKDMTIRYGNCSLAGGIRNEGTLTVTNCVISDNIGTGNVGAMYTKNATVVFSSTKIINNSTPGLVGGIYHLGNAATSSITLTDCTISGNSGRVVGGIDNLAVSGGTATATLDGCTISDNESDGTSSDGGGIRALVDHDNSSGTVNLTNCTFFGNKAGNKGGAIELDKIVENSTLSVNLVNCTIAGNIANSKDLSDNNNTNYIYGMGGGIFVNDYYSVDLTAKNCIIADNFSGAASPIESDLCVGENYKPLPPMLTPNIDYSIIEVLDIRRVTINGSNNITGDQPNLNLAGTLANNGGSTETLALLAGSVAIDAGTDAGAPATDQRGYDRVGITDIGAYEYFVPSPIPIPTLSEWGMIILFLLTISAGFMVIRRRRGSF